MGRRFVHNGRMTTSHSFQDHFSGHAADYARFRPHYPPALFEWLAQIAPTRELAWDCATGSGQAAVALSERFAEVVATDASAEQVAQAEAHPGVRYAVAPAEASGLADASVDLVTVAQALHWFDLERFYAEVRRVLRSGGVLAVWSYGLFECFPAVDAVVRRLYSEIVGPCWPMERRLVEDGYRSLPYPFPELAAPAFAMDARWTLAQAVGYLNTWSAVRRYRKDVGQDPLSLIASELSAAWGDPAVERSIRWPLHLRIGRMPD